LPQASSSPKDKGFHQTRATPPSSPDNPPNNPNNDPQSTDGELPFGASLEPVLRRSCFDRLSSVNWFRTDWQRGGALTGYATFRDNQNKEQPVVVKLPVGPDERHWLLRLGKTHNAVAPKVYADGNSLGDYDMAWVVMERLPYGPLGTAWKGTEFDLLIEAAGQFYAATNPFPVDATNTHRNWEIIFHQSRQSVHHHQLKNEQRWNRTLKKAHRKLKSWQRTWDERPIHQWCHGDLHLANAMTRSKPPNGPAVLLDLASVQAGSWVEDAVYLEHLYWGRRDRLAGRKPCKQMARQLKQMGLPVEKDWSQLASVLRSLLAMSTPATLCQDGNPKHVQGALEVLEVEVNKN